jgi:endonuclease/exonuclease/phosphatase family metal-dependent hydrolase
MKQKKTSIIKKTGMTIGLMLLFLGAVIGYLLACEYKPAPEEEMELIGSTSQSLGVNQPFTITSWNIGYGGLDASADFFMDGGKQVHPVSEAHVQNNMTHLAEQAAELNSDILLLQEVDINADRSYAINEAELITQALDYPVQSAFGYSFNVKFVPFPLPPIGHVESGILTLNSFPADGATRIALDSSFPWPISAFQLKRCLLVERMPLADSDKELVLINLHLEAYDNGEGKAKQTAQLVKLLNEEYEKGNYVIAGGDFNSMLPDVNPELYPLKETEHCMPAVIDASILPEGWQYVTDDSVPTSRLLNHPYDAENLDNNQFYVIDGFILSPNVTLHQVETVDYQFQWSDHNPVRVQVELAE